MKLFIKISSAVCSVHYRFGHIFTEEILNGKLHFFYVVLDLLSLHWSLTILPIDIPNIWCCFYHICLLENS